ncbi:PEP-CTERM sorting domain-containing protein [Paucibacter sp. APW11]|uniref:PEP-CTERM sorting domain-containing protein n=1 Tax=Roseateles aquae TaxID=3077235 RepID=A0ABU3PHG6_9BURK|nr:PEP-CTERM sorting domain-containing protein [Paucibacter sp. APW11]MDT9002001.1 PEP-CTERM sorting domain-containing protein [Paucibacter sp. APW11]
MLRFTTAGLLLMPTLVLATSTFGSLANFDAVNDTGRTAHGFEIELEGIDRSQISDVFGLNRNFGTASPGDVERYGLPLVGDLLDGSGKVIGVKISYQASYSNGSWSASTASGSFNTPGESCWTFGNVNYPNVPCDHFGVSTLGAPTATRYSWLVESATPGVLSNASVAIPAVNFTPPVAPAAPVVAVIKAQQIDPVDPRANAFWVKIVQTTLAENADLNELLGGHHAFENPAIAALNDKSEIEIEWQVLQPGFVDEVSKSVHLNGDASLVVRYEFYKYLGRFDDEGLVDPMSSQTPHGNALNEWVGAYVGEQIAGFNAVQAVPEPGSWLTMALGLAALSLRQRRSGKPGRCA